TSGDQLTVEQYLLGQAQQLRPDQVRHLGRHFARVADPDADERGYQQAKEREYVEFVRTLDGWHLSGVLTEESGRLLRTALDAVRACGGRWRRRCVAAWWIGREVLGSELVVDVARGRRAGVAG